MSTNWVPTKGPKTRRLAEARELSGENLVGVDEVAAPSRSTAAFLLPTTSRLIGHSVPTRTCKAESLIPGWKTCLEPTLVSHWRRFSP